MEFDCMQRVCIPQYNAVCQQVKTGLQQFDIS